MIYSFDIDFHLITGFKQTMTQPSPLEQLLKTMEKLRDPDTGCPWDIEQTFESIASHTIEEAYEVADAISNKNMPHLKEELGDLLLQVVYHAQIGKEQNLFNFDDIASGINHKMISRHPHVFGDETAKSSEDVNAIWDIQKDKEKEKYQQLSDSVLDDVPLNLPALLRCQKLQKKAARQGFSWPKIENVLAKLDEEINEFKAVIHNKDSDQSLADEFGDMLFVMVNIARHFKLNPEECLRQANQKFYNRYTGLEKELKEQKKDVKDQSLEKLLELWARQKEKERATT